MVDGDGVTNRWGWVLDLAQCQVGWGGVGDDAWVLGGSCRTGKSLVPGMSEVSLISVHISLPQVIIV